MSTISASTTSNTAFKVTSDTTGTLVLQTGAVPTTAISIDASQVVSIGSIAVTGVTTFSAGSAAAPSITTTGDTNTGIFFPAADTIAASTAGSERLRLDSNGNLGIGTSSPAFRLHVSGSSSQFALISTTDTTSTTGVLFGDSASDTVGRIEYVHSTNGMAFFTNGTTKATLDSSGNLGIGMTPNNILDITQNQNSSATSKILNNSAGAGARVDIIATNGTAQSQLTTFGTGFSTTGIFRANGTLVYATGAGGLTLSTDTAQPIYFATNQSERMRIDSSGNVGIGTTSSTYPLQVRRPGGACSLGLTMDNYGAIAELARSIFYYAIGDSTSDRTGHLFFTRDATATDNLRLVINSAGNVGIGTSSPWSQVSIGTPSGGSTGYFGVKDTVHGGDIRFGKESGVNNNAMAGTFTNNDFVFYTNSTERARIGSAGELLVGTTSSGGAGGVTLIPLGGGAGTCAIQVFNKTNTASDSAILFRVAGSNVSGISYTNTTVTYGTSSDRRLKENIAPADDAGSVIDGIKIVKHDWKIGGHTRYGMIAQDLHMVAPEAVSVGDADDVEDFKNPWGVDYSKLVPMLVKELQSVRARLAALESK